MSVERESVIKDLESLHLSDCENSMPFIIDIDTALPSPTDEARIEPSSPGANMRSPDRRSPNCNRGKTIRDFEEELGALKRENFDLKMRIYVLNEHLELIQSVDNVEEIYETHTKLKKEINALKTELADKEDLILKTGDAMNLLSNKHREEIALLRVKLQEDTIQYQTVIEKLKQELAYNNKSMLMSNRPDFEDSNAVYAMAFGYDNNLDSEFKEQVAKLEAELCLKNNQIVEADFKIKNLEERILELQDQQILVEKDLQSKNDKLEDVFSDLRRREIQVDDMHKKLFALETSVKEKDEEIKIINLKLECIRGVEETNDKKLDISGENVSLSNQLAHLRLKVSRRHENRDPALTVEPIQTKSSCKFCLDRPKLEEKIAHFKASIAEKESELNDCRIENRKTLKALQGFIKANKALTKDTENLKIQLKKMQDSQGNSSIPEVIMVEPDKTEYITELENKIKALTDSLEEKEDSLKEMIKKAHECDREDRVEELELLVSTLKGQLDTILTKESKDNEECNNLKADIESKNKQIEQLNEELRKRTFNLQELVNKELWDKNREIEKLNNNCEKKQNESMELRAKMESQQEELMALNDKIQELSDNINSKLTKKDVERIMEQLKNEKDNNKHLVEKCNYLEKEINKSEKARKDLVNACVLLQTRLEELVFFMDSLIPNLNSKNKLILQEAVERSREASRALSLSVLEESAIPILPDFSQVDFRCDSFNLDKSKENLANQNKEVSFMRLQLESVVEKLDDNKLSQQRDKLALKELNDMAQSFALEEITEGSLPEFITDTETQKVPAKETVDVSESEEWSEPDRDVSKARIGIDNEAVIKAPIDSSDISEHSDKNPSKRRHKSNEVRKLNLKLKKLGNVIETLRLSPSKGQADSSFTIQINDQASTATIVDKILEGRRQIDGSMKLNQLILNQINTIKLDECVKRALEDQLTMISDNLTSLTILCQEMEGFLIQAESDKKDLCLKMFDNDRKIETMNTTILRQQSDLKEKENEVLEKQCALLELKNKYLISENRNKNIDNRLAETNLKLQEYLKNAEKEKQVCKELQAQEISKLQHKLKHKQEEHNKELNQLKVLLEKANDAIEDLNIARVRSEDEHKQQLDLFMKESKANIDDEINKRMEAERKLVHSYEIQADLRNQLENEITNTRTIGSAQRKMESWWRKKLHELEAACLERESDLRRRLDATTLSMSQAVLERTKLANEKIRLQCELRRRDDTAQEVKMSLEQRVSELEELNVDLEKKLASLMMPRSEPGSPTHNYNRQRSNPTSDYQSSDPDHHGSSSNLWYPLCGRNNNNCSPDLGIESDQGRLSSLDAISSPKSLDTPELLKTENSELRQELAKTKHALSKALNLLQDSKNGKKQIEKDILLQIHKTNHILSKARLNLEAPNQPS